MEKCPCMSGCRGGCPCPDGAYDCHDGTLPDVQDTHILIINPKTRSNYSPDADQIKFSLTKKNSKRIRRSSGSSGFNDSFHEVELNAPDTFEGDRSYMCSFTNHGHMYLAGGAPDKSHRRRLFKIQGNDVVQLENMPFDFGRGLCVGNLEPHGIVLFCADRSAEKSCHTWDGYSGWHEAPTTTDSHYLGGLEIFQGTALIFGGVDSEGDTEMLEGTPYLQGSKWNRVDKGSSKLKHKHNFSTVSYRDSVYFFGGHKGDGSADDHSYRWNIPKNEWKGIDSLKHNRANHKSVTLGDKIIHIGGTSHKEGDTSHEESFKMELWIRKGDDGKFDKYDHKPTLKNWESFPYAFLVGENDYEN